MGRKHLELSVIVPCWNEEGNVELLTKRTLKTFQKLSIEGELIFVNDGSSDRTASRIAEQQDLDNRVTGVHHQSNKGIECAWLSGIEVAKGKLICLIDGDLQNKPEDIATLYKAYITGAPNTIIQGFRRPIAGLPKKYPVPLFLSYGLNFLLNLCFGTSLRDNKSGFILCAKPILKYVLQHHFHYRYFQCFLGVSAIKKGYLINEVETKFDFRNSGKSFLPRLPIRPMVTILFEIIKYRVELSRTKTMIPPDRRNS